MKGFKNYAVPVLLPGLERKHPISGPV